MSIRYAHYNMPLEWYDEQAKRRHAKEMRARAKERYKRLKAIQKDNGTQRMRNRTVKNFLEKRMKGMPLNSGPGLSIAKNSRVNSLPPFKIWYRNEQKKLQSKSNSRGNTRRNTRATNTRATNTRATNTRAKTTRKTTSCVPGSKIGCSVMG